MKKVWFLICTLAFIPVAGFTQTPDVAPLPSEALAAILSPPAATTSASCPTSQGKVLFAAAEGGGESTMSACTATANCASGTVYCEGNSSCDTYDRDCTNGERGHVTCDGVTTWCPTACSCPPSPPPNICANCNTCAQTGDCFACCICNGYGLYWCGQTC